MEINSRENEIVRRKMYDNDAFSKWLGIEIEDVKNGECTLVMQVRSEMLNGFGIAHGGITYSFADSALAFASNSLGRKALSIDTSISHTQGVKVNETLKAKAVLKSKSYKIGLFEVVVSNAKNENVAFFKGTVYFKDDW